MTSALLSILVPPAQADTKNGEQRSAQGALLPTPEAPEAASFGQMLSQYQARLQPVSHAVASPAVGSIIPVPGVARTTHPLVVAGLAQPFTPIMPTVPEGEAGIVEAEAAAYEVAALEEIQELPEIDTSAFSLTSAPIAYTTDAQVVTVAVFDKNPAKVAPVAPPPNEALSAFVELAPARPKPEDTLKQALISAPAPVEQVEAVDAVNAELAAPVIKVEATDFPEISLPEYPAIAQNVEKTPAVDVPEVKAPQAQAVVPEVEAPVQAQAPVIAPLPVVAAPKPDISFTSSFVPVTAPSVSSDDIQVVKESKQVAQTGIIPLAELEVEPVEAEAQDVQAVPTVPVIAAMGGPLVQEVADAGAQIQRESVGKPDQITLPNGKTIEPGALAPAAGQGKGDQGDAGGNPQQQGNTATPDRSFQPLSDAADASLKPQGSAKASMDDFSALMSDKSVSTDGALPGQQAANNPHAVDNRNQNVPLVKLAHASAHIPVEEQISVRIRQAVDEGVDQITMKLNPPELGKIQIKMEIASDGRAQVVVTADNRDTFEMLQRDARGLERVLNEAGVKTDSGSLQFDLREQPGQNPNGQQFESDQQSNNSNSNDKGGSDGAYKTAALEMNPAMPTLQPLTDEYTLVASEGVDIRV